jgi:hypothetical protein
MSNAMLYKILVGHMIVDKLVIRIVKLQNAATLNQILHPLHIQIYISVDILVKQQLLTKIFIRPYLIMYQ